MNEFDWWPEKLQLKLEPEKKVVRWDRRAAPGKYKCERCGSIWLWFNSLNPWTLAESTDKACCICFGINMIRVDG
jgi:hypothetical protein